MDISHTDLILNADGSVYHLNLLPGDIADTIILVGDQDRVKEISRHFEHIELEKGKREFITHTGSFKGKRLSVISTGIGTDNIDIVLNELDALANIDLATRRINSTLKQLKFIRIGTSGATQEDILVDSLLISEAALGLDCLMNYYQQENFDANHNLLKAFTNHLPQQGKVSPYFATAGKDLLQTLGKDFNKGITVTAPGFYAPQGRSVRAASSTPNLLDVISSFNHNGKRITNLEMETAGIYGLANILGHQAISFNVILANRATNNFSTTPAETMHRFIAVILSRLVDL